METKPVETGLLLLANGGLTLTSFAGLNRSVKQPVSGRRVDGVDFIELVPRLFTVQGLPVSSGRVILLHLRACLSS